MCVVVGALVPDVLVARSVVSGYDDLLALLEVPSINMEIVRGRDSVDDSARAETQDFGVDRLEEGTTAEIGNVDDHLALIR